MACVRMQPCQYGNQVHSHHQGPVHGIGVSRRMKEPMDAWPCKKSFCSAPEEEMRKDMLVDTCNTVTGVPGAEKGQPPFPSPTKVGLDRLLRVYGYLFAAAYKWRKKEGSQGPVLINSVSSERQRKGYPSSECRQAREMYLLELAQKRMQVAGAKMLAADGLIKEGVVGRRRRLITVSSRAANYIGVTGVRGEGFAPTPGRSSLGQTVHEQGTPEMARRGHLIPSQVKKRSLDNWGLR